MESFHDHRRDVGGFFAFASEASFRRAGGDEVFEDVDRRFVEAEVLHRASDGSVLDGERSVPGQAGVEEGFGPHHAKIPEPRDEDAVLDLGEERIAGLAFPRDDEISGNRLGRQTL